MSQREGRPRTTLSQFCLHFVSLLMCREHTNEWQVIWNGQSDDQFHPPESGKKYMGHIFHGVEIAVAKNHNLPIERDRG